MKRKSGYSTYRIKVGVKDQVKIEKDATYRGMLSLNCSNVANGIYLMHINHGTKCVAMKVMVKK